MIRHVALGVSLFLAGANLALPQVAAPSARTSSELEVIAPNGADKDVRGISQNGVVPLVLVRPNQPVPVTLQFPTEKARMPVAAMPLDGGEVTGGRLVVLPTGRVVFVFQPGPAPGRYRLLVRTPLEQHLLEFYVVDPAHSPRQQRPRSSQ